MKLLLVGATGLVGRNILDLALADTRVSNIVAPVRKVITPHVKLQAPVVDFEALPEDVSWWKADAVICALGTTMKTAGSREAFRRVDYDYPLMIARMAQKFGVPTYVLNSAMGANPASMFFYNRIKGQVERDLGEMHFRSLTIVRPGLIGGEREEFRAAEVITKPLMKLLGPVLPKSARINPAPVIARKMLEAAIAATPGKHFITSAELCSP